MNETSNETSKENGLSVLQLEKRKSVKQQALKRKFPSEHEFPPEMQNSLFKLVSLTIIDCSSLGR
jgi:hypothetical protein